MTQKRLSEQLSDRLRELANIGCGYALSALSRMTDKEFFVRVPEIDLIGYDGMPGRLGDVEEEMVGVLLEISGELSGLFLLLLKPEIASVLLSALNVAPPESYRAMRERQQSALLELGNILCSAYMTAVSQMTGLDIKLTPPSCAVDMLGALLSEPLSRFARLESLLLYIRSVFAVEGREWVGCMLFMPELDAADLLGQRLGALL